MLLYCENNKDVGDNYPHGLHIILNWGICVCIYNVPGDEGVDKYTKNMWVGCDIVVYMCVWLYTHMCKIDVRNL